MVVELTGVLSNLWQSTLNTIPNVAGALIILVVGYIVGRVVGRVVKEIILKGNVDSFIRKREEIKFKPSSVLDIVARWIIYLVAIRAAFSEKILGIQSVATFVNNAVNFLVGVVWAGIIVLAAYGLGIYIKDEIVGKKTKYADLTGKVLFFLILYLGIALALPFVAINPALVNQILLIIIGAVGVGMAIAIGLGLKDIVRDMAKDYAKEFKKRKK